ncbi:integrase core domain-containing protein [Desulfopila sp. IMCC35006]|uniref:integrase core domain-containing protein n=1 Tax=Desulfopila sp. IMCC35006 TaxID=2569542 RepID=UPI00142F27E6|nr:integrase core domain-containing protein [Desulfopila sp. IMCC35006]
MIKLLVQGDFWAAPPLPLPEVSTRSKNDSGRPPKPAISLESCHAVDVLREAFARYGTPEIINTDQSSQFTADEFVQLVINQGCRFSMDVQGAWRDNIFVERLWKTVKYEEVYLYASDSVNEARRSIIRYPGWYNHSRPHSSINQKTPSEADEALLPSMRLAA